MHLHKSPHEDVPHHMNDADCTEVDEQKESGLDLFYFLGVYAIVKMARECKMGASEATQSPSSALPASPPPA
jgi:hypothetical protein